MHINSGVQSCDQCMLGIWFDKLASLGGAIGLGRALYAVGFGSGQGQGQGQGGDGRCAVDLNGEGVYYSLLEMKK